MQHFIENKSERIAARTTPEVKAQIARAALLRGQSITDFVLTSAQREAEATLRAEAVLSVSAKVQAQLAKALLAPAEPNRDLKAAYKAYRDKAYGDEGDTSPDAQ